MHSTNPIQHPYVHSANPTNHITHTCPINFLTTHVNRPQVLVHSPCKHTSGLTVLSRTTVNTSRVHSHKHISHTIQSIPNDCRQHVPRLTFLSRTTVNTSQVSSHIHTYHTIQSIFNDHRQHVPGLTCLSRTTVIMSQVHSHTHTCHTIQVTSSSH